jgi:hypothetical protein
MVRVSIGPTGMTIPNVELEVLASTTNPVHPVLWAAWCRPELMAAPPTDAGDRRPYPPESWSPDAVRIAVTTMLTSGAGQTCDPSMVPSALVIRGCGSGSRLLLTLALLGAHSKKVRVVGASVGLIEPTVPFVAAQQADVFAVHRRITAAHSVVRCLRQQVTQPEGNDREEVVGRPN